MYIYIYIYMCVYIYIYIYKSWGDREIVLPINTLIPIDVIFDRNH